MPYTEWTEELSVGVEEMDAEHQQWLSILNELSDAVNLGKDRRVMGDIINRMLDYSTTHLAHEEMYMLSINYPNFSPHKAKHDTLIRKVKELQKHFLSGAKFSVTIESIQLLKEWLFNHIKVIDKKYGPYAASGDRDMK